MNKYVKIALFGVFIWLIPFVFSFVIFELRETNRPLFESIMPVLLTITVMFFSIQYFKKKSDKPLKESLIVGVMWFLINIIIDIMLFIPESPMQMTIADYMMDIGLTYVIILAIPIGIGYFIKIRLFSSKR